MSPLLTLLFLAQSTLPQSPVAPTSDSTYLVPSNQLLRPAGRQIYLPGGRPVGLALTKDGRYLLVKNIRTLDLVRLKDRVVVQSLPIKGGASFNGICLAEDGHTVYLTQAGDRVSVATCDGDSLKLQPSITLPHPAIGGDPAPGGVATIKGALLVTLSRNNSLAVITNDATTEIPVGIAPYEVLPMNQEKVYVTNWGGRRPQPGEYTENTSGSAILVDPGTGIASDGSVSVVDLRSGQTVKNIPVGLHPSAMALSPDKRTLYVACAN